MGISDSDVAHIEALSMLRLESDEAELFKGQLNDILLYIDKLNELDTSDIEPTSHVIPLTNVFREDVLITSSLPQDQALKNAPDASKGFYRVPKIIE
ncbi:MAG: Asp-tRNA(Asn)/Glu-tRNA(Gln) amidotransferase subunit GatC [Nitrospirae bacterium]|nr:Asp-tRNA(Asn)/Glu-tRNA(Gln) amidotransferase subunit GatC [Nitrospirota bacterium]